MAHLFISYSKNDREIVEKLAITLEESGHSVWWDRHIRGGAAFAKDIEAQLEKADGVIVAWSSNANESDWVKDEAVYARDKQKLIPICLTDCEAPIGFRQYQTLEFQRWKGATDAPEIQALQAAIARMLGDDAPAPITATSKTAQEQFLEKLTQPVTLGVIVIALVTFAVLFLMRSPDGDDVGPMTADADVSIAVLPFSDMSPERNQKYFADGLSEELLDVLVRIEGLGVASRTSSFVFTEQKINELNMNIEDIATRLKVNHILEGSVRKMGDDVRITAQLIDARENKHLWSDTFDRRLSDIFRIQEEIATAVVSELRDKLVTEASQPVAVKRATENLNAYDKYLHARELYLSRSSNPANVRESLTLFEEVVEMDPDFARGWEGLAAVYGVATSYGILDRDYSALALVANKKALEIDPDLSMPYAVIGLTYRAHYPTPWAESMENLQNAIDRDPANASAWQWLGMNYVSIGAAAEAVDAFTRCLEIDETRLLCRRYRSVAHLVLGDVETAMADAQANSEVGYFNGFDVYIPIFLERGDRMMAFAASRIVNWQRGFDHDEFMAAMENPDDQPEERLEAFLEWGRDMRVDIKDKTNVMLALRAYDLVDVAAFDNDYMYLWLPQFSHYRKTPQFKQLVTDLGLVTYWQENGFPPQCQVLSEDDFECA